MVEIKTENLTKKFKVESDVIAVNNISIGIPENKIILLTGPSGSGKTTLLSLMGLLLKPTSGKIFYDEEEVSLYSDRWQTRLRREKIGFIFQQFYLEPRLNVWENVSLPLLCRETNVDDRYIKAEKILIKLDLGDRIDFPAYKLSGGEQQRVAIARALISSPELIFADEPTSSIDEESSNKVVEILLNLRKEGKSVVVASHDTHVWCEIADLIFFMEKGIIKNRNSYI